MSNTKRRTNADGVSGKWLHEGDLVNKWSFRGYVSYSKFYASAHTESVILSKEEAHIEDMKYHSDAYESMRNAPKWYRQDLNRKLRSKQKAHLAKCFRDDDFDNYSEPRFVRDAAWYW